MNNKKIFTMKKFLSLIIAMVFSIGLKAQSVSDFTATDYFGNEIHLYEILEGGQYVLLHVNTRTNEATPTVTPPLVEAYKKLGCNQHDVFFIGIVPNGTTNVTKKYVEEYGIEYPMIHNTDESNGMEGPAMDIWQALQCEMPTTMLIAPDKSIAIDDISNIKTVDDVTTALAEFGIEEYECSEEETISQLVDITVDNVTTTTITASFTPNEDCGSYFILLDTEESMQQWMMVFGVTMEQLIEEWSIEKKTKSSHTWKEIIPNTEYTIYVLPRDKEGNNQEIIRKIVKTEVLGDEGLSVIDVKVEVKTTTSVFVTATPNASTAEYHYILIEKAFSELIGVDSTMKYLYQDPYALYEIDEWEWIDLVPNTEYYAIAQGKNAAGEWGEITTVEFITTPGADPGDANIEVVAKAFNIYPNPASTDIKITSEMSGQAEINIFDLTGRCVKNIRVSDISNATINVSDINKGVYFININGKVEKLTIK